MIQSKMRYKALHTFKSSVNNQKSKRVMIQTNIGACMTEFKIATFYLRI